MVAVGRLIGAHAALTRELSAQLVANHELTLSEYEVLMLLASAPDGVMRRVDLAHEVRLSPSGVTRMLDRLEAGGLVGKALCDKDARVTYAQLTEAGREKLSAASKAHVASICTLFEEHFADKEIDSVAQLLGKLPGVGNQDDDCSPG